MIYQEINDYLHGLSDLTLAQHLSGFFKTGRGEYGHGDKFLGIRVPVLRQAAKKYNETSLCVIERLISSEYHEIRLFALLVLVLRFQKVSSEEQKEIYNFYLAHTRYINSWDLVDLSSYQIVGAYLCDKNRSQLYDLVISSSLWERRIAIVATWYFIRQHDFNDTLHIAEQLLHDKEDLIHKAVGWMLREVGKKDRDVETSFLKSRYQEMPRTMLRSAIEKFDEPLRQRYLKGTL